MKNQCKTCQQFERETEYSYPTSTKSLKTCHLMTKIDQVIEHGGWLGAFAGAEK